MSDVGAPVRRWGPPSGRAIRDASRPGRRAGRFPDADVPPVPVPEAFTRREPAPLPEVSEIDIVRHYTRSAQRNYGLDTGFYPLGSCSMKHNPKLAETAATMSGYTRVHPLQPERTTQGTLELLWRLERALCEITGTEAATLQPPAGACGEMTGLLLMRAFHRSNGEDRRTVLIPDSAHGTNPASVTLGGYRAVAVPSDARGLIDVDALEAVVDEDVAGLMLTNPNTLGLFERDIERIIAAVHGVGGLAYYDGANLNAIMGHTRPGDMGFDIVHVNTHKTFATPHGGGGPGAGPVGVVERLVPFLPVPRIERDGDTFRLVGEDERSIGRMHGFHGNVGILVRAYTYIALHGADGLRRVSDLAVLNANYLAALLRDALPPAFPGERPMHEFVASLAGLERRTGIRAGDVAKRLIDLGFHPPTVYFPLVVDEAVMVEPTETETKETLEAFAAAVERAVEDARSDPDVLRAAPRTTPVGRLDEARAARRLQLHW